MTLRLLLVDDDKDFLKVATLYLKRIMPDTEITVVSSAEEAHAVLHQVPHDAVICDYQMPGTDGLELLKSMRDSGSEVPFIILTAHSREDIAIRALNLGATHYLTKGTDPKFVYAEIKHVIESSVAYVQAKRLLEDSEEKYRTTIQAISDALHVVDKDMRILVVNQAFEDWLRVLGLDANVVGKTVGDAFPFLQDAVLEEYRQVFAQGKPILTVEQNEVGGSGIWTETRKFPVMAEGIVTQVVTVVRNVTNQRENEELLRLSEERYRTILHSVSDVVFVYDRDNHHSQYYAPTRSFLHGVAKDFMWKKIDEVLPEDVAAGMLAKLVEVRQTKQAADYEFRLEISGQEHLFSADLSLHEDGESVIAAMRDITRRRKTEDALRSSEERYRRIFEGATEGIFAAEVQRMVFTSANPAMCRMLGYTEDELMKMSLSDVLRDPSIMKQENGPGYASSDMRRVLFNVVCTRKNGEVFYADISHAFVDVEGRKSIVGFFTDVTERNRQDSALRRSEEWFRTIFNDSPVAINVFDSAGRLLDANQACLAFAGVSKVEDLRNFNILDDPNMPANVRESLVSGEQITAEIAMDFDLIRRLGTYPTKRTGVAYIQVAYSPLTSQHEVLGYAVQIVDVTQLRKQRDELSSFAHSMAHDLRSSIHNMMSYATLIEDDKDPSYAPDILKIAANMNEILTKSVELADSGLVVGDANEVDLNEVVTEVASRVIPDAVELKIGPLPTVLCDRSKIIQVVQNLMMNAIEHGRPNEVIVESEQTALGVDLLFRNDGSRILDESRSRMLEQGFSTKSGGGLGLIIVRRIVEAHGWTITLDPGDITTFRIKIPSRSVV